MGNYDLKLPWSVEPEPIHGWAIKDADGSRVVRDIYWEEHARLIIRAVNSHEALVTALRALEPYFATEAEMLDYASLNEGRASGFDTASMKARVALACIDSEK